MKYNLDFFSELEEVIEKNAEAFKEEGTGSKLTESFTNIKDQLEKLGYSVLINHNESQEFVPKSRVDQITSQKGLLETQVNDLNAKLQEAIKSAGVDSEASKKLMIMQEANTKLLEEMETKETHYKMLHEATKSGAIDPNDVLLFIDKEKVKNGAKGLLGMDKELERLKTEKPYLFGESKKKETFNKEKNDKGKPGSDFNSILRAGLGRTII